MKPDIGPESRFVPIPPAFDAPNIATTFGVEKLEWCGYPIVKKLKICLFVLSEYTNVTDRHADGRTDTA